MQENCSCTCVGCVLPFGGICNVLCMQGMLCMFLASD
jgi:hypothetical protein